jgi:hypothetical protein
MAKGNSKMEQVLRSGERALGEQYMTAHDGMFQREDDLGFAAALKLAIPAGLLIWALIVVGIFRFIA